MEMSDAVQVLDALAQESRLGIYRFLIGRGPPGAAAGEVAEELQLHAATLSFHLSALRKAGLVLSRRESRSIIYSADFKRMTQLIGYLTENCCSAPAARRADSFATTA